MQNAPEILGAPVAVLALLVAGAGFVISLVALGWQITKHLLDGGRVRVGLNAAIWEPDFALAVNRSGKWSIQDEVSKHATPEYFEVAQLVVENPGRTPVTVYSPGIAIAGTEKKGHSMVPRMFELPDFGADTAVAQTVVRIEPYDRVTFLLDYWSVVPRLLSDAGRHGITIRGYVEVAGRKRPSRSARRVQWRIAKEAWTSAEGPVRPISPHTVIWREFYRRYPTDRTSEKWMNRHEISYAIEQVVDQFDERPTLDEFTKALKEIAKADDAAVFMLSSNSFAALHALDRYNGHLRKWNFPPEQAPEATLE